VASRFPLFADNHVQQAIVDGLIQRGWDVVRAIDLFPEGTGDDVLFEHAVKDRRVMVTNDGGIRNTGRRWHDEGRAFPGLVYWPQKYYRNARPGYFIGVIEAMAEEENPFVNPIRFITRPK